MFIEYRIRSGISGASEVLTLRQAALSRAPGTAEELVQIAVVAYREGEVGILELLDAARTPPHEHGLATSICDSTPAWHKSLWNAQWETHCGPEIPVLNLPHRRARGRV